MTSGGADTGPDAGSNLVQGVGTNAATFTLPGSPRYKVESVVASVDNGAGGDTTATLTLADQSGEVIAEKTQARVIPAGDTGTATFALGLDDEVVSSGGTTGFERFNNSTGETVNATSATALSWVKRSGDDLLDLTTPTAPTVINTGIYAFTAQLDVSASPGPFVDGVPVGGELVLFPPFDALGVVQIFPWHTFGVPPNGCSMSMTLPVDAGTLVTFTGNNSQTHAGLFVWQGFVQRLA